MKRKLIDLKDSTFNFLSADATTSGTNLKQYIEGLLDDRARILEDSGACKYRFASSREPSDSELSAIMNSAAESVVRNNTQIMSDYFSSLAKMINAVD